MKLFFFEIYKVVSRRYFVIILAFLCLFNLFMASRSGSNDMIPPAAQKVLYEKLHTMTDHERLQFLEEEILRYSVAYSIESGIDQDFGSRHQDALKYISMYEMEAIKPIYTDFTFTEIQLYQEARDRLETVLNYDLFLSDIDENASLMLSTSFFSKESSFSHRNIARTPGAYSHLRGISPEFGMYKGVLRTTDNDIADAIALLLIVFICSTMLLYEKDRGLLDLVRPTVHGRRNIMAAKLSCTLAFCVIIYFLLYGGSFFMSAHVFGMSSLSAPIQSVDGFMGSTLDVSVLEYLMIFSLSKITVYFLIALMILLLCMLTGKAVLVYLVAASVLAASMFLYTAIEPVSILSPFKYINLISFLKINGLYDTYLNINLAEYPINVIPASAGTILASVAFLATCNIRLFSIRKNVVYKRLGLTIPLKRISTLTRKAGAKRKVNTNLLYHETLKILFANKAIVILLVLFLIQGYCYTSFRMGYDSDEARYKNYMTMLEGKITEETHAYIEDELRHFTGLEEQLEAVHRKEAEGEMTLQQSYQARTLIQRELAPKNTLNRVTDRVNYIERLKADTGIEGWLLYETGYGGLTADHTNRQDFVSAFLLIIFMSLYLAPVFGYEYSSGMADLIRPAKNGRASVYFRKALVCAVLTAVSYGAVYAPGLLNASRYYGLTAMGAPAQSLESLSGIPFSISILQYMIILYGARFIAVQTAMLVMLSISIYTKNVLYSIFISLLCFALPLGISLLGGGIADSLLFNPLLGINILFKPNSLAAAINSLLTLSASFAFIYLMFKEYCRPARGQ